MNEPTFKVVLNDEDQYSVWPAPRANPAGWRDEGTEGTREECLDHIEVVWRDMRPRGVRGDAAVSGEGGR